MTSLDTLRDLDGATAIAPAAFIFHASRCGSTLVTQMLSCIEGCRCISEPPAMDHLLARLLSGPARPDRLELLRGLVAAFGQAGAGDRHLFIKFDSWHVAALPLLREAFPGVPCWFLHRDPADIMRSHQRERGSQMVPGLVDLTPFCLQPSGIPVWDLDGYAAAVLGGIFHIAADHVRNGTLKPWNATTLPDSLSESWLAAHGVVPNAASLDRMRERAGFHSKNRHQPWQPAQRTNDSHPAIEEVRLLWQSCFS